MQRLPLAYGWLSKRPVPDDVLDSWVRPFLGDAGVRRDARRALAAIDPALLLDNALQLGRFDRPVLIAWAPEDRFFPVTDARRLAAVFTERARGRDPGRAHVHQLGPAGPARGADRRNSAPAGCGAASRRALLGIGRPGPDP